MSIGVRSSWGYEESISEYGIVWNMERKYWEYKKNYIVDLKGKQKKKKGEYIWV